MANKYPNDSVKNVYVSFPENPNPENHELSPYTKNIFLQTTNQFIECLGKQEGIKTVSRCEGVQGTELTDKISNCDCVILVCCPAVVYLLSDASQAESRLEENQFYIELKTIYGQNIAQNKFRIIPVILNTSSDSLHKCLPPEIGTNCVSICISTVAEFAEELWPAQQKSIEKLVRIIRMESVPETTASPCRDIDAVDEEWCLHFIDQFAIDFISCVFEERNIYTDITVLMDYLEIKCTQLISVRELLRIWLREVRRRKVHSVFEEMRLLLGGLGREDLMYQLKAQYEFYKEEVYQQQNIQSDELTDEQTK